MTIGITNHNPFNVKQPNRASGWLGTDLARQPTQKHAVFLHPVFSVRAACRQLANYERNKGADTLIKKLAIWAPSDDTLGSLPGQPQNNPHEAAEFIAQRIRLNTGQPFAADLVFRLFKADGRVASARFLVPLLAALAEHETFAGYELCPSIIRSGIAMYERDVAHGVLP